jgi:hypothetical protein
MWQFQHLRQSGPQQDTTSMPRHLYCRHQGSQAPPADFNQLVEGPWPISTSCPPGGLCCWASAFWSKYPLFRAQGFDQLIEQPAKISEISGLRPKNFNPSMSLRALAGTSTSAHEHCAVNCQFVYAVYTTACKPVGLASPCGWWMAAVDMAAWTLGVVWSPCLRGRTPVLSLEGLVAAASCQRHCHM